MYLDQGALTFMERVKPDLVLAVRQHAAYREAVAKASNTLIDVPAADDFPDSTFVEDVLIAFPECFILCRPGTASRVEEPELIKPYLPNDRPVLSIKHPATIDGGDVLQIGREVFVGLSKRTNQAAITALADLLSGFGYTVKPVQVNGALHLKTAVTAPFAGILLANTDWVDLTPFGARRILKVDPSEPFAGNALTVGDQIFMQSAHNQTAKKLRNEGAIVHDLDISEFAKIEAGLTCMSVVVPPPA